MRLIDADELINDIKKNEEICIFNSIGEKEIHNKMVEYAIDQIEGAETVYCTVRLKELAEADKEGRCLVLPCKVGDTYYTIQKTCSDGGYAKKGEYFPCESDCEYCDIRDCDKEFIIREHKFNSLNFIVDYMEYIGEFLFLTKEEAEKALEGLE